MKGRKERNLGKRYGIPYLGSKEKILPLIQYIIDREYDKKYFIDPFCGGFSVSAYIIANTEMRVLANDLNTYVIALYKEIFYNKSAELNKVLLDWISRERFFDVKKNSSNYPAWYVGLVLPTWSFGNNQEDYLFGRNIEEQKHKLHQALVFNQWDEDLLWLKKLTVKLPEEYSASKRIAFMRIFNRAIKDKKKVKLEQLERLERLEQLERLERLNSLQQLDRLDRLEAMDWFDFIQSIPEEILKNAIIYCDPPYEAKAAYPMTQIDYQQFWTWFKNCPYSVYVSSYSAPDDVKLLRSKHKRVLLNYIGSQKLATENLYFNGKKTSKTMFDGLFLAEDK